MINSIRHVGIVVNDLEKCLDFWLNTLKFEVAIDQYEPSPYINELLGFDVKGLRTVKLRDSKGFLVELLKFEDLEVEKDWKGTLKTTGLTHLAITVMNLGSICENLKNGGFEFVSEIKVSPDKKVNVVFAKGPENLFLELVQEI